MEPGGHRQKYPVEVSFETKQKPGWQGFVAHGFGVKKLAEAPQKQVEQQSSPLTYWLQVFPK